MALCVVTLELLVLSLLARDTVAVNPGFQTTITAKGLDYSKFLINRHTHIHNRLKVRGSVHTKRRVSNAIMVYANTLWKVTWRVRTLSCTSWRWLLSTRKRLPLPLVQLSARAHHVSFHRVFTCTIVAFDTIWTLRKLLMEYFWSDPVVPQREDFKAAWSKISAGKPCWAGKPKKCITLSLWRMLDSTVTRPPLLGTGHAHLTSACLCSVTHRYSTTKVVCDNNFLVVHSEATG